MWKRRNTIFDTWEGTTRGAGMVEATESPMQVARGSNPGTTAWWVWWGSCLMVYRRVQPNLGLGINKAWHRPTPEHKG